MQKVFYRLWLGTDWMTTSKICHKSQTFQINEYMVFAREVQSSEV